MLGMKLPGNFGSNMELFYNIKQIKYERKNQT